MNKLFVISGSSGVGKGTLIKELLKQNNSNIKLSVSTTTRKSRKGEINGIHYFFVEKEDFIKSVENNEFIEHAEFSGNFYGTKKEFVENTLNNGQNVLLEIDTQGALQIKEIMPEAILIFIAPPSLEELKRRLINRGTETEEAIQKRLSCVEQEQEKSKQYDYIVINDTVENAVQNLENIFKKENNE